MGVNAIEGSNFCVSYFTHDTIIEHYILFFLVLHVKKVRLLTNPQP